MTIPRTALPLILKASMQTFLVAMTTTLAFLLWVPPTLLHAQDDFGAPRTYSFVSVELPNTAGELGFTTLADIDNAGDIASGFTNSSGPGTLLRAPLRAIPIRCPGDADGAQPQGVSGNGDVVGFCSVDGVEQSFLFERRGRRGRLLLRLLAALQPGHFEAFGLNDLGNIVGIFTDDSNVSHGAILSGTRLELIDANFPGTLSTTLSGINNLGDMIGVFSSDRTTAHGFLLTAGTFTPLDVPNATSTVPVDINDAGVIIGLFVGDDGVLHSFVQERGSAATEFVVPFVGAVATEVRGLNNRGQIVGRYTVAQPGDESNPFASRGFVATPDRLGQVPHPRLLSETPPAETVQRLQTHDQASGDRHSKGRRLLALSR